MRLTRNISQGEYWDLGPRQPAQDLNRYLATRWEVRATWDLSRLVFDRRELTVSSRTSQLADQRRRLVQQVIRLYYERCSLIDMQLRSAEPLGHSQRIRMLQLTASLDALTGGLYSKEAATDD